MTKEQQEEYDHNDGGVRHPEVVVQLTGHDGNAFAIMSAVRKALLRAGVSREEVGVYIDEATSADYTHLLIVTGNWVSVQ